MYIRRPFEPMDKNAVNEYYDLKKKLALTPEELKFFKPNKKENKCLSAGLTRKYLQKYCNEGNISLERLVKELGMQRKTLDKLFNDEPMRYEVLVRMTEFLINRGVLKWYN